MEKVKVDHSGIIEKMRGLPIAGQERTVTATSEPITLTTLPSPVVQNPLLASIEKGRKMLPPRIVVYGQNGVGKSTFAASAPKPVFIQTEKGLDHIDCEKFPLANSIQDVYRQLEALTGAHNYETVAIDSLDWLERLIWKAVCEEKGKQNIEDIGFAKGYIYALTYWNHVLETLDVLRSRGMAVILIAHSKIEKFEDPFTQTYDRYSPRLHKHSQALVTEWADAVLFATHKFRLEVKGQGFDERAVAQPIGAGGGDRILRTVGSPACVAKNRYNLPPEISLDWNVFMSAFVAGQNLEKKGA